MKKIILLVFISGLILSSLSLFGNGKGDQSSADASLFNETGMPIMKEKTHFEIMGILMNNTRQGRHDQTDMMKALAEETNIDMTWTLVPQNSWQEKKNLVVASGEYPDAFHAPLSLSNDEIAKFGADGVLIPMDDLLDKYAPNIMSRIDPMMDAFTRSMDGNIYAMASMSDFGFDSLNSSIIKTEWLDALGLDMPTTTEEFYQVLKAFKTQDPNGNGEADEIPWSFLYIENPPNREVKREHYWIFPCFGVYDNPYHIAINDSGKLMFTANTDEWREAVEYLHRLYSEGLIDKEVFSQDRATLTNKVRNQATVGAYTDYRFRLSIAAPENEWKFALMPPLEGPHGDKGWMRAQVGLAEGAFAITSACQYPEALVRWLDHVNEEEIGVQMAYGMFKPAGYSEAEALIPSEKNPGKYVVNTDLRPESVDPSEWPFTSPISITCTVLTSEIFDKYIEEKDSYKSKQETCDVYRPYLSKYPYNYPFKFTVTEIEELSMMQADILSYIYSTEAKWIAGGFSDSDWNNYLKELDRLNIDRYTEMYKTAFDRQK